MNDAASIPSPRPLDAVLDLVGADMEKVNTTIRASLASDVVLINQISEYIISAGGKRMRPLLVLLSARACGYDARDHISLAAVIEFIHTATLLHDDVVDESNLRRGRDTANAVFGNAASVLVGDFLYSRSFQMMVALKRMSVMQILADATNAIAEGEVLQLMHAGNPDTTSAEYFAVIENKTARLFAAAAELGGVIAESDAATCSALRQFGLKLGVAFQIADDVLDYVSDAATMGKNLGDDLAEGKVTLPLIIALERGTDADRAVLRRAIETCASDEISLINEILDRTDATARALEIARDIGAEAMSALDHLPGSPYRDALDTLTRYAINRSQ